MKHVVVAFATAVLAITCAVVVSALALTSGVMEDNFFVAMWVAFMVTMAWFPAILSVVKAEEELAYWKWRRQMRRKMARRRVH
jgi:hypothetical protein